MAADELLNYALALPINEQLVTSQYIIIVLPLVKYIDLSKQCLCSVVNKAYTVLCM